MKKFLAVAGAVLITALSFISIINVNKAEARITGFNIDLEQQNLSVYNNDFVQQSLFFTLQYDLPVDFEWQMFFLYSKNYDTSVVTTYCLVAKSLENKQVAVRMQRYVSGAFVDVYASPISMIYSYGDIGVFDFMLGGSNYWNGERTVTQFLAGRLRYRKTHIGIVDYESKIIGILQSGVERFRNITNATGYYVNYLMFYHGSVNLLYDNKTVGSQFLKPVIESAGQAYAYVNYNNGYNSGLGQAQVDNDAFVTFLPKIIGAVGAFFTTTLGGISLFGISLWDIILILCIIAIMAFFLSFIGK